MLVSNVRVINLKVQKCEIKKNKSKIWGKNFSKKSERKYVSKILIEMWVNNVKLKKCDSKKFESKNVRLKNVRVKNIRVQKCQSNICDIKKYESKS